MTLPSLKSKSKLHASNISCHRTDIVNPKVKTRAKGRKQSTTQDQNTAGRTPNFIYHVSALKWIYLCCFTADNMHLCVQFPCQMFSGAGMFNIVGSPVTSRLHICSLGNGLFMLGLPCHTLPGPNSSLRRSISRKQKQQGNGMSLLKPQKMLPVTYFL